MRQTKSGRNSAMKIAGRIGAALLSLVMIVGLLPFAAFADANAKFNDLINPGTPNQYSDDMANPYGYAKGKKFMMAEQSELWLY